MIQRWSEVDVAVDAPRRPAVRYYGGKWRIAPWIIRQFPRHICYVEPFGGGASVLLRKPPAHLEVYNDKDQEVVNFFQILRERTEEFIRAVELTPFSRFEVSQAYEWVEDDFERARRFYVRVWQARGGPRAMWRTGWRFQRSNARGKRAVDDWRDVGHLREAVERLREVQIECDDAVRIIERYDAAETLYYLDPPYLAATRSKRWASCAYAYEMTDNDHRALARALSNVEGMAIVSGYPSDLYDKLYAGWVRKKRVTRSDANTETIEHLWLSPRVQEALAREEVEEQRARDRVELPLFYLNGEDVKCLS